jgi:hypothetical protein
MNKRHWRAVAVVSAAGIAAAIAVPMASADDHGMYNVSTCRATVGESHYSGADAAQTAVTAAEALSANATVRISGTCAPVVIDDAVTPHTITLRGAGRNPTVDGQGNPGSVVTVQSGTTAVIRGLKITGGTGAIDLGAPTAVGSGGGIHNDGTLTVRNSRVTGNAANAHGGGIFSTGPLTVIDSRVDGNTAPDDGGGIATDDTLTVRGSRVDGNTAVNGSGGGIFLYAGGGSTASVTDSRVNGNSAGNAGGGIQSTFYTITILRSQVNGNQQSATASGAGGGGIVAQGRPLTLTKSQVNGNTANAPGGTGGGIRNGAGTTLTLTKSQVNRNTAAGAGGGIWNEIYGSVSLVESQVNSNSAGTDGGGIWNFYYGSFATVSIFPKSKVQHNTAGGYGGGIWADALGTVRDGSGLTPYSGTGVAYNTSINGTSTGNSPADLINIFEVM